MLPVSTGFSDKLRRWDPAPGPDKVQALGVSSSQMGSTGGSLADLDSEQGTGWPALDYQALYQRPTFTCSTCPVLPGGVELSPLPKGASLVAVTSLAAWTGLAISLVLLKLTYREWDWRRQMS